MRLLGEKGRGRRLGGRRDRGGEDGWTHDNLPRAGAWVAGESGDGERG